LRYVEYSRFAPVESSAAVKPAEHGAHPDPVVPEAVYSGHNPLSRLGSNAFTSAFKELEPIPQFRAAAALGEFLKGGGLKSFGPDERSEPRA